jgi:hypothetical protein
LQQLPLTSHTVSAHGERGASGAAVDQRYPIGCAAAPASAGHEGERRLTLRGRSPTIRGPGLEAAAQRRPISPRHRSARRKATAALPRRRDSSGIVLAECPGPSALAQRPARLASGQVGRTAQHPNSLARRSRPPSPEHARAHGSEEAAATAQCRLARDKSFFNLLLRSSHRRRDSQPSRARLWPLRQAPVSNPSMCVLSAQRNDRNEAIQGQIAWIYSAGQGTEIQADPIAWIGRIDRIAWIGRHHPHDVGGEDSERAQVGRSGPAGRCPREADDTASTPGGSRGAAQPTRSSNSERLASGSRQAADRRNTDARTRAARPTNVDEFQERWGSVS